MILRREVFGGRPSRRSAGQAGPGDCLPSVMPELRARFCARQIPPAEKHALLVNSVNDADTAVLSAAQRSDNVRR